SLSRKATLSISLFGSAAPKQRKLATCSGCCADGPTRVSVTKRVSLPMPLSAGIGTTPSIKSFPECLLKNAHRSPLSLYLVIARQEVSGILRFHPTQLHLR